jgi:hypothetical protein
MQSDKWGHDIPHQEDMTGVPHHKHPPSAHQSELEVDQDDRRRAALLMTAAGLEVGAPFEDISLVVHMINDEVQTGMLNDITGRKRIAKEIKERKKREQKAEQDQHLATPGEGS